MGRVRRSVIVGLALVGGALAGARLRGDDRADVENTVRQFVAAYAAKNVEGFYFGHGGYTLH